MPDAFVSSPCDVCGHPATHWARDVVRCRFDLLQCATLSDLKSGCPDHPVTSVEHLTDQPLDEALASRFWETSHA